MATLTEEERTEIRAREDLIRMYQRTATLLQSELRLFLSHVLTQKGLDPTKTYDMNPETGELTERVADG